MKKIFKLAGEVTLEGVKKAEKDLTAFEKSIKKSIAPLVKLGRQAENVGKQFTKTVTVPLTLAGGAAIKFAGDFQKSMVTSTAIMGNVSKDMQDMMSETAKQISKESTFSAAELANSYYYLASAGYTAEQSIAALGKVSKFAEAGQFDLQLATDLLTDAQSALGLASKDAAQNEENLVRVSDVLVKANTLANASVQQFSEALTNRAGAALRSVGKDIEEGAAVLAAYADQGTKGAEAGTQLSIVTRDLQKAALENSKEFKKANVSVYDANGEMRNYADIIEDVEKALEGKSDAEKKATLATLGFQEKSVASLLTLVGTSEKIREYEKSLKDAGGTTEEVSEKQLKNFNDQMKILYNRIQVAAINLGEVLLPILQEKVMPAIEAFIQEIENMVNWFAKLPAPFQNFLLALAAFAALIGPTLLGFGKLLGLLKMLPAAIGAVKIAVSALSAVLSANPWIAVIGGAIALGIALWKVKKAYANVNSEIDKNRKRMKEDIEAKQLAMKKGLVEELIYYYKKLADVTTGGKEYHEAKRIADKLETSLADLGTTFEGGYIKRLEEAEAFLTDLNTTKEEVIENNQDEIDGLKDLANGYYVSSQEVNNLAKAEKDLLEQRLKENEEFLRKKKAAIQYEKDLENSVLDEQDAIYQKYRELTADSLDEKIQLLTEERNKELALVAKGSEQEILINKHFDKQIQDLRDEERDREQQILIDKMSNIAGYTQQVVGLFQGLYANRAIEMDNDYKREKEKIENSLMNEEDKNRALEDLDEKYTEKKKELAKKQAIADKASAIFSIGINTASAIIEALPNLILSGFIGALGAAQAAIVASKPIPAMAEGGVIKKSSMGTIVRAAESGEDEGFIPMTRGTASIANAIIDNMKKETGAASGVASGTSLSNSNPISFHIGTFIGDDAGIKELTRRVIPYINSENRRKGI